MYKMLFCTGVTQANRPGALREFEEWKGGVLHIAYYLQTPLPAGYSVKYLCDNPLLGEVAIKIVAGGMLSKYAIIGK